MRPHTVKERVFTPTRVLSIGFLSIIIIGAVLLMLPISTIREGRMAPIDAFFVATSSVCVTGLTVIEPGRDLTRFGQVVLMLLIQTGGLGFMTISSLLFMAMRRRITMRDRIALQTAMGEDSLSGMVKLVKRIVLVAFLCEGMGAIALLFCFVPEFGWGIGTFYAVFHAVSAFCNAGFDLLGGTASYMANPVFNIAIMVLIVVGGLGFAVVYDLFMNYKSKARISLHAKVVLIMTGALLLIGCISFCLLEWDNPMTLGALPPFLRPMAAMFQSVTLRTAGFAPINQADLAPGSRIISILLMFVGASPASAGGGIKTTTFAVLLLQVMTVYRGREEVTVLGRTLPRALVQRAMVLSIVSIFFVASCTVALTILMPEGKHITTESLLFEAVSAFATVGLTMNVTPHLNIPSKALIIFLMYIGRIGPMTFVIAMSRRQARQKDLKKYPDGRMMIG